MELYHALNRGVDGRDLFIDDHDRTRFVHNLYEFNDAAPILNVKHRLKNKDLRNPYFKERELLVDIHGWVLMKNHYHILLSERVDDGVRLFLRKLNVGYANYFNEQHERKGTLFQGRTKKTLIENQPHFLYILHYLHFNPLDYLKGAEEWRLRSKGGILNTNEVLEYLDSYRWSSYLDHIGKKNFPSILTKSFFRDALGNYKDSLTSYLRDTEYDTLISESVFE
jgi:putative transposase